MFSTNKGVAGDCNHILKQRDLFFIKQVSFCMIFYMKRVLLAIFPYIEGGDYFV